MKPLIKQLTLFFFLSLILSCKEDIPAAPVAKFTFVANKAEATFTNLSQNAESYSWDFGDGGSSTDKSPKHTYKTPGRYTVVLKALGSGGDASSQQAVEILKAGTQASFSYKLLEEGKVQLINESKEADTYLWQIPERSIVSRAKDTTVKFEFKGSYTIKLEAKGFGATDTTSQVITVTSGKEASPIARFTFTDKGSGKYAFTNLSVNAVSYRWDFGDGEGESTEESPEYTFSGNGEYNVKLEATGKGGKNTAHQIIKVTNSYTYYSYTLENKTQYTIRAYNNFTDSPLDNFKEVTLVPGQKQIIKTRSDKGLRPYFRHNESEDIKLKSSSANQKDYSVSSYIYFYEVKLTGTCEPVTVTTNISGKDETREAVALPAALTNKSSSVDILELNVAKNNVNGYLNIQVYMQGDLLSTVTTSDPFGSVNLSLSSLTKKATFTKRAPEEWPCGMYNGRGLITGPKGGCYYINSNGNKTYVDRSYCHCN